MLPILDWTLTDSMVRTFQGELVKRMLKWPKHLSSTVATAALEVPSMRFRVLEAKLGFLS